MVITMHGLFLLLVVAHLIQVGEGFATCVSSGTAYKTCYRCRDSPCCLNLSTNENDTQHENHAEPESSRRLFFSEIATSLTLIGAATPAWGTPETIDSGKQCNQGALLSETAIPGAYEQSCMQMSERTIPLRITQQSKSGSGYSIETKSLVLRQGMSGAGNTGLAVWNSSLLLVRLLEAIQAQDPAFWNGRSVLELGCGPGLASMAASYLGAASVRATDGNPSVVSLALDNIRSTTSLPNPVVATELSWGLLNAIEYSESVDCVIGSDLTYNAGTWRVLAETMETVLKPDGFILYLTLGHSGLNVNAEVQGFLSVAQELGLTEVTPLDPTWPFPKSLPSTSLTNLLLQQCVSPQEMSVIQGTGGVRVMVLQKKRYVKKKT